MGLSLIHDINAKSHEGEALRFLRQQNGMSKFPPSCLQKVGPLRSWKEGLVYLSEEL